MIRLFASFHLKCAFVWDFSILKWRYWTPPCFHLDPIFYQWNFHRESMNQFHSSRAPPCRSGLSMINKIYYFGGSGAFRIKISHLRHKYYNHYSKSNSEGSGASEIKFKIQCNFLVTAFWIILFSTVQGFPHLHLFFQPPKYWTIKSYAPDSTTSFVHPNHLALFENSMLELSIGHHNSWNLANDNPCHITTLIKLSFNHSDLSLMCAN